MVTAMRLMHGRAGRGGLSVLPARRTVLIAMAVCGWLGLQLALVGWWATKIGQQARRIAMLEAMRGADGAAAEWSRTRLMLVGESVSFLALLLAVSLLLAWMYWREHQRTRAIQGFFAAVTHELRTPLTSIRLQAEAIAEGEQGAQLAQRLLEDSHRLESQIDKTLELARIQPDLALAHGTRLDVRAHVDAALPPVQADAAALQMILRNLIENSVRHSRMDPVKVRLTAAQRGDRLVLEYQDN